MRLKPGETVGWHTTGQHEEALVVLHGHGEARIEGQRAYPFIAPQLVYIPPATRHNIANRGHQPPRVCVRGGTGHGAVASSPILPQRLMP